jgi:hypothetical protein
MSSNINPNNIDGTYPVAGQDNNSQGFRDNFTNIKTNFQYAEDEISELQSKALLKAPLTGTSVVDNDMLGQPLTNGVLGDMGYEFLDLQTPSGSTVTINYVVGQYQAFQTSQAFNLAFSNFPPAGVAGEVYVRVNVTNVSHTMTLQSAVSQGLTGIQGISGQVITFAATGIYNFRFTSTDGGSTITVYDLNRPLNYYTNPLRLDISDSVVANGNISLTTTTSIVGVSSNLTGNLLAGSSGQIKILAYGNASAGNALINVVNAGWKSTGNGIANLSATGSAATFQYIGSKWYCVGNNGVTFS